MLINPQLKDHGRTHLFIVDNNRSVNEIMENESLFHDTTRSGVEWNKLEFSIISLTERLLCILYVELCCCRA